MVSPSPEETLQETYGNVTSEMLDRILHDNEIPLGMKYAMRDAKFHPERTQRENFDEIMRTFSARDYGKILCPDSIDGQMQSWHNSINGELERTGASFLRSDVLYGLAPEDCLYFLGW